MRMPPLAFFLVGLVFFTQVDDLLIPAPCCLATPLVDDDDEYLSPEPNQFADFLSARQQPVCVVKPETASSLRRIWPSAFGVISFSPSTLYVFMSCQC